MVTTSAAEQIIFLRKVFELSQRGLARVLGVATMSVYRWEKSMGSPTGLHAEVVRALYASACRLEHSAGRKKAAQALSFGVSSMIRDAVLRSADHATLGG